jgi:hypothetical protein
MIPQEMTGSRPQLTVEDVRKIVKEELAKQQ